jgi:NitT/TauT family transport system ATP-binding protein
MLDVTDLRVAYDDVVALDGVDLTVAAEEFVTVIGPSGCGKTTLLRAIGGLERPTRGRVRIDGDAPAAAQAAARLGFVFQEHTLLPWKTALENVTFLRRLAGEDPAPDRARDLLEMAGLGEFADARPATLSGGMKQRVAIVRALHLGADVLLMDEPFGELDELTRNELAAELLAVWRREPRTVVFVTHSVPEAVLLADRCVVFGDRGRVDRIVDVDVERPRTTDLFGTERFGAHLAEVREVLHGGGG